MVVTPGHLCMIAEAIKERRVLVVAYSTSSGPRRVEPHACGWSRAGHALALVYQASGPSASDPRGGWRMMRLDRVRHLQVLDDEFAVPREDYLRGEHAIHRILAEL